MKRDNMLFERALKEHHVLYQDGKPFCSIPENIQERQQRELSKSQVQRFYDRYGLNWQEKYGGNNE